MSNKFYYDIETECDGFDLDIDNRLKVKVFNPKKCRKEKFGGKPKIKKFRKNDKD